MTTKTKTPRKTKADLLWNLIYSAEMVVGLRECEDECGTCSICILKADLKAYKARGYKARGYKA
jgi:hypothetical protein